MGLTHYTVRKGDSVMSVAKHFDTSVNVVRELNGLPQGRLTVGADLRVPSSTAVSLPAKVMLAAARVDGKVRENRRERRVRIQVVHAGESLWSIARRHHVNVNTLASMNGMRPGDSLHAGQKIRLATGGGSSTHAAPASYTSASASATAGLASTGSSKGGSHAGRRVIYIVRAGDSLRNIAKLFQVTVSEILSWNGIRSETHILRGQKLTIRVSARGG
jgi:membrane-bound lytic murein transglycosylase D